jgi:adhesin transport system membrane fusion protein
MTPLVQRIDAWTAAVSRRLFGPTAQEADAGLASFEAEAEAVMSRQRTQRAQAIVRTAVVVVLLLLLWAALAHVDEVTRGDARVIPSRQLQLVQSLDGGVVS